MVFWLRPRRPLSGPRRRRLRDGSRGVQGAVQHRSRRRPTSPSAGMPRVTAATASAMAAMAGRWRWGVAAIPSVPVAYVKDAPSARSRSAGSGLDANIVESLDAETGGSASEPGEPVFLGSRRSRHCYRVRRWA
jgi:hypothetical protein